MFVSYLAAASEVLIFCVHHWRVPPLQWDNRPLIGGTAVGPENNKKLEIMQQSTFVQFGIDITQACLINFIVLSISDVYVGLYPLQVVSELGIDLNISISQVMVGD